MRIRVLKKRKLAIKDRIQTLQKSISDLQKNLQTAAVGKRSNEDSGQTSVNGEKIQTDAVGKRLNEDSGQTSVNGKNIGVLDLLLEKLDLYGLKLEGVPPHRYVCMYLCMYVCMYVSSN